ncbi:hypothetical protein [Microvirga vignae]|nr:hypothetical protein [Microvirga vignae]
MKCFIAAVAATLLLGAPAIAKWETDVDEDPMTDDKVAYMETTLDGDDDVALAMKCWDDKDKSISLYVYTGTRYDKAAKYEEFEVFSLRVDKGEVFKLPFAPVEDEGYLMYELPISGYGRTEEAFRAAIKMIGAAKGKVAVEMSNNQYVFDVGGSDDAFDTFRKTCKLDLSS